MSRILFAAAALVFATLSARAEDYPVDIDIVTANTQGAGTDAVPISLTISYINTNGEENGYLLRIDEDVDPQTGENRFEQGRTDRFRVELPSEVDHFTQIELSSNIANLDHVSETFTMAAWEVESVTLTPARNRRLPDGELLAITPTVIHINRRVDATIPTIIAYPDDHPVAAAEPEAGGGPEPIDQPELEPEPTTDSPGGSTTAEANNARCRELVQGKVAWDRNPRSTSWNEENLERLCSSGQDGDAVVACFQAQLVANDYQWEPAVEICRTDASGGTPPAESVEQRRAQANRQRCIDMVQDQISWSRDPATTHWGANNLERLCGAGRDAAEVVDCFQQELMANGYDWSAAIDTCTLGTPRPASGPAAPAGGGDLTQRCKAAVQDKVVWDLDHPDDPVYRHWNEDNLGRLCQSRAEPPVTISCFSEILASNGNQWSPAIDTCSKLRPN